jgi:alcohol dehydrogenase class IV
MAGTAFDAICHCVDGYISTWNNDFSDAFLIHAFKLLWRNLPIAYDQAKEGKVEVNIREKLHNAASMAGWGFGNSQIILAHALGHSIGAGFHIPHSGCIGTACWYSMMYNREEAEERLADLARNVGIEGNSDKELTDNLIDLMKDLLLKLEMPLSLQDMNITRDQFDKNIDQVIDFALNDSGTLSNPRPVDYEDYVKIFDCMFEGNEIDF